MARGVAGYLSFKRARRYARTLFLRSARQRRAWVHGEIAGRRSRNVPEATRAFARSLRLPNVTAWQRFCRRELRGGRPPEIPATPDNVYRHAGWLGYADEVRKTLLLTACILLPSWVPVCFLGSSDLAS
jgi:hypothetical protein